jgi:hypothetical protein
MDAATPHQLTGTCLAIMKRCENRIRPTPRIPLGVPRWLADSMQPPRFALAQDNMLASARRASQVGWGVCVRVCLAQVRCVCVCARARVAGGIW